MRGAEVGVGPGLHGGLPVPPLRQLGQRGAALESQDRGDEAGVHGAPEVAHQPRLQRLARAPERDQSGVSGRQ